MARWNARRALSRLPLLLLLAMPLVAAPLLISPEVSAKTSFESPYTFERTWNSATRLVRVDLGYKITEKDESGGYFLFEYKSAESGGKSSGSMEFVKGLDGTRVVVQLPQMPNYHEQVLIDQLSKKLRLEYGDPVRVARGDGGAPSSPDSGN